MARYECMTCGSAWCAATDEDAPTPDSPGGTFWTYCKRCDCWTEHPLPVVKDVTKKTHMQATPKESRP